jgi:hypothetical protein
MDGGVIARSCCFPPRCGIKAPQEMLHESLKPMLPILYAEYRKLGGVLYNYREAAIKGAIKEE